MWPEADMPVRLDTVHRWQSGGEHSEIHFCTSSEPCLEIITCKLVYFSASATTGARLAGLSNTIGDEDLDVSDVRQTATYGERAKVLVGVAHIIGLVIILRKEF